MHINEVSFMYSWEGPLEEEMVTHSSISRLVMSDFLGPHGL